MCNAESRISRHDLWKYKAVAMTRRTVEWALHDVTTFSKSVHLVCKAVSSTNISVKNVYMAITRTSRPV